MDLESTIKHDFDIKFDQVVERSKEVDGFPLFLPHSHFSPAIAEARKMYRMGYYYGVIMLVQSIAEALARFVAEAKGMDEKYYIERDGRNGGVSQKKRLAKMKQLKVIKPDEYESLQRILTSKRNSFHHMTSDLPRGEQELRRTALECFSSIFSVEGAFAGVGQKGKVHVRDKDLWTENEDGTTKTFIDGYKL